MKTNEMITRGLEMLAERNTAPRSTVKEQKEELTAVITAETTLNGFFESLKNINYALSLSKSLFVNTFGIEYGANIYNALKLQGENIVAYLLSYETAKTVDKLSRKQLDVYRMKCFNAINEFFSRIGYTKNVDYKLTIRKVDALASKAYRTTFTDKNDIAKGYSAKAISGISMLNIVLREVMIDERTLENACNTACKNTAKTYKKVQDILTNESNVSGFNMLTDDIETEPENSETD